MKTLFSLLLIGAICTTMLGCNGGQGGSVSIGATTNTVIYGRGEDAATLDPINTDVGESVKVMVNLFDTLVTYHDETTELVPSLATEWSTSEDGRTWTFKLREKVKFHDGTPFNADAVVFSFERIILDEHPQLYDIARPYRPAFTMIERVTATAPLEVQFTLKEPSAVFLGNLAMFPASIVCPTALKELGQKFGDNPVGTGPFKFEKWSRYERLVLAANDDHWRGRPEVDRVIFVPVSERATRVEKIRRGEIDIADNLAPDEVDELIKDPNVVSQGQPGMNVGYLTMQTERPPLNNAKVRTAIGHAISKADLIELAYSGQAQPAVNMVPTTMWGHNDDIQDRPYDPEKAREMLEQAAAEDGFAVPVSLTLAVMSDERPYMQKPNQVASYIKDALKPIGILVTVEPRKANEHFELLQKGDYDLGLGGWSSDNTDPDNFLYTLLDLDNISDHGNNLSKYRNEELHELLINGQREMDQEKRETLYHQAQEIIFRDAPVIPLVHTNVRIVLRKELKGYKLHPTSLVRLRLSRFD